MVIWFYLVTNMVVEESIDRYYKSLND